MLAYLKETRKLLNTPVACCIVIGNESCDLDSAVSAIALAYCYQNRSRTELKHGQIDKAAIRQYVPVLNTARHDFPLKTEVKFWLGENCITDDILIFKSDLNDGIIKSSKFILVDHHISPYSSKCIEVFDHRPENVESVLPPNCKKTIELVGSCASLIGEIILQNQKNVPDIPSVCRLLQGAIVLDTGNFSDAAARATPKDSQIYEALEKCLISRVTVHDRNQLFERLLNARADISGLSTYQLLLKDMKIITNNCNTIKIGIPGFPILVQDFITKQDALKAVEKFKASINCNIILLIGMLIQNTNKSIQRDIGIIVPNASDQTVGQKINEALVSCTKPNLGLQRIECTFMKGSFYKQDNVTATRKHIIPIVQGIIDS